MLMTALRVLYATHSMVRRTYTTALRECERVVMKTMFCLYAPEMSRSIYQLIRTRISTYSCHVTTCQHACMHKYISCMHIQTTIQLSFTRNFSYYFTLDSESIHLSILLGRNMNTSDYTWNLTHPPNLKCTAYPNDYSSHLHSSQLSWSTCHTWRYLLNNHSFSQMSTRSRVLWM